MLIGTWEGIFIYFASGVEGKLFLGRCYDL
jgi:hypothetical protein